jgi:hypothetical protein
MSCKESYPCKGYCWMNVAGPLDVWDKVSEKCQGTLEQQKMNDDYFNGKISRSEFLKFWSLQEENCNFNCIDGLAYYANKRKAMT